MTRTPILHYLQPHRLRPRPFDAEGYSFRYSYYTHPWELVWDGWRELRAIITRGLYGWHYSDAWSADSYLATLAPALIEYVRDHHCGVPVYFCDDAAVDSTERRLTPVPTPAPAAPAAASALDRAEQKYRDWLTDKADAWREWTRLLQDGPYARYFIDDWQVEFDRLVSEHGYTVALKHESPLSRASEAERRQARDEYTAALAAVCARLHDLIDHLYVVSD